MRVQTQNNKSQVTAGLVSFIRWIKVVFRPLNNWCIFGHNWNTQTEVTVRFSFQEFRNFFNMKILPVT